MNRTALFLLFIGLLLSGVIGLVIYSAGGVAVADVQEKRELVLALKITDLALCSEARYTRHPTQADLFSAFQDSPALLEHFPTGSLLLPQLKGFDSRVIFESSDRAVN